MGLNREDGTKAGLNREDGTKAGLQDEGTLIRGH